LQPIGHQEKIHMMQRISVTSVALSGLLFVGAACSSGPKESEKRVENRQTHASNTQQGFGSPNVKEGESVYRAREVVTLEKDVPTVTITSVRGDINRMEEEHFRTLGMNEQIAKNIVDYREEHGEFRSVSELRKVPGVDSILFNRVRDKLGVSPTG
jgi:competence ComEA-like helix-hairpin-helix protein